MPAAVASGRQRRVRPAMDHSPAFERARGVGNRRFRPHPWTVDHLAFEEKRGAGTGCRRQERAEFSDLMEPVVFPFRSCGYGGLLSRGAAGAACRHIHRMAGFCYQRGDQGQQRRELQIPADDPLFQLIFSGETKRRRINCGNAPRDGRYPRGSPMKSFPPGLPAR
jgi:hypothetical protein